MNKPHSWISPECFGPGGLWPSREAFEAEARHFKDTGRVEWIYEAIVEYPQRPAIDGGLAYAAYFHLYSYLQASGVGQVFRPAPAFMLQSMPRLVRIPDVAFLSAFRPSNAHVAAICDFAPNLIVEVMTQRERQGEIEDRVRDFLKTGTEMAWIVDFETRTCEVRHRSGERRVFTRNEKLRAPSLLPRLNLGVYEIFEMFE